MTPVPSGQESCHVTNNEKDPIAAATSSGGDGEALWTNSKPPLTLLGTNLASESVGAERTSRRIKSVQLIELWSVVTDRWT